MPRSKPIKRTNQLIMDALAMLRSADQIDEILAPKLAETKAQLIKDAMAMSREALIAIRAGQPVDEEAALKGIADIKTLSDMLTITLARRRGALLLKVGTK